MAPCPFLRELIRRRWPSWIKALSATLESHRSAFSEQSIYTAEHSWLTKNQNVGGAPFKVDAAVPCLPLNGAAAGGPRQEFVALQGLGGLQTQILGEDRRTRF